MTCNMADLTVSTGEDLQVPLVGIADLVIEDHEGPVIVDFKTAARSAAPLEISHEIQLISYAYLVRHVFGKSESALKIRSLIETETPQIVVHRYLRPESPPGRSPESDVGSRRCRREPSKAAVTG